MFPMNECYLVLDTLNDPHKVDERLIVIVTPAELEYLSFNVNKTVDSALFPGNVREVGVIVTFPELSFPVQT